MLDISQIRMLHFCWNAFTAFEIVRHIMIYSQVSSKWKSDHVGCFPSRTNVSIVSLAVHFSSFHFLLRFFYISFQFIFFYISLAFRFNSVLPHFSRLHVSESSSVNHLKRRCFTIEMKIVNESKDCSDLLFIDKFRLFETSLVLYL